MARSHASRRGRDRGPNDLVSETPGLFVDRSFPAAAVNCCNQLLKPGPYTEIRSARYLRCSGPIFQSLVTAQQLPSIRDEAPRAYPQNRCRGRSRAEVFALL